MAVLALLENHPSVAAVPVLRLHRGLRGSDVVARIVLRPDHAARAEALASEVEAALLAQIPLLSATLAIEPATARRSFFDA